MNINNLILEMTYSCNNNCVYCYIPNKIRNQKSNDYNIDYFRKQLLILREKKIKNVDFTGGEPTLHPKLLELVKFSKNLGYNPLTLVSNGRRLAYKDYFRKLVKAGINRVVFSLDGPTSLINDSVTRTKNSFEQVKKAIINSKEFGVEVGVSVVVNKLNYKFIPDMIEFVNGLGVDFFNIQFLLPFVKDEKVPCKKVSSNIIPSYEDSVKYVKKGIDKIGDSKKVNVYFIPFCYMKNYEKYVTHEFINSKKLVLNFEGYSYYVDEHLKKGATKTQRCVGCKYEKSCVGFFSSYTKELGIEHEFK